MKTDFGADGHWWEFTGQGDRNGVVNTSTKRGDIEGGVVLDVVGVGDETEEVPVDELFLGKPKLLVVLVDNCVLVRVTILGEDTSGFSEEVWEEGGSNVIVGCGLNRFSLSGRIGQGR